MDLKKLILFNSFDSENHLKAHEGKIDLVSFFSTIAHTNLLCLPSYLTKLSSSILI